MSEKIYIFDLGLYDDILKAVYPDSVIPMIALAFNSSAVLAALNQITSDLNVLDFSTAFGNLSTIL